MIARWPRVAILVEDLCMIDKAHIAWAADAMAAFQKHCGTGTNMQSQI